MIERKIKELSIAFEALSRINDPDAAQCISDVADLLKYQLNKAKEEIALTAINTDDDDLPF